MPDKRWWRRGLVRGVGALLMLVLLAVTAVASEMTWTNPENISWNDPDEHKVRSVDLAVDGNNKLHAVWTQKSGPNKTDPFYIYYDLATFSSSGGWEWSGPNLVRNGTYQSPAALTVETIDSDTSRMNVVYPNNSLDAIQFSQGTCKDSCTWTVHSTLSAPPGFENTLLAGWPVIAVSGSVLHVAWGAEYNNHLQIVHGTSIDGGVNWPQSLTTVVYTSTQGSNFPDMAVDKSGDLHVVWEQVYDQSESVIYYSVGDTSGGGGTVSWSEPITVSGIFTNCHRPSIAIAGDTVYVAWGRTVEFRTDQDVYYSTKSVGGGSWPTPKLLPNSNVGVGNISPTYVAPRIAATSAGRVIIVWNGRLTEGGAEDIHFTETTNIADDNAWTERDNVSSTGDISYGPAVALGDGGAVHVMWIDDRKAFYSHSQYQVFLPLTLKNW